MKNSTQIILFCLTIIISANTFSQTPSIKWWYNTNDAAFGQSASDDIDGDGKLEVVFGCYRNDSMVYALNAENGTLHWKYNTAPIGFEGCNDVAPVIYNMDTDPQLEVVVPSSCNAKTFCFNGVTGAVEWIANTRGSDSPPTVADIDKDGKLEIIHGEFGGYVICINAENGTIEWEIAVDTNSWIQTAPTVLDLDNDNTLDFVVGTWDFNNYDSLVAFKGDDQTRMWSFPINDHLYHGTAVADFDNDGKPELLFGSYNDTIYCLNGEDGTLDWKYGGLGGYAGANVSLGDIDNDGNCDVVFVSGYKVTALEGNGVFKWSYDIPNFGTAFRGVVLSDVNGDQYLDVVFGTETGKLISLHGNSGLNMWTMDLRAHYGDNRFELSHAPLIADFDGDDTLDVFIAGGHAEYPAFTNGFGRAYMISTGAIANGPDWLMFQKDIWRQSSHCNIVSTSIEEPKQINESSSKAYPNPTESNITVSFDNQKGLKHQIIFYNTEGKIVFTDDNIIDNKTIIDVKNWAKGIYYYKLNNSKGLVDSKKIITR
ncbi:MAG: FG-GAP-like repeat-containing protein [Vicingaceae bacterium]|nr:FG-GAP-like repeat-containing protein [Vicingaceae bacterium]